MHCIKKKTRSFLELFSVYRCRDCIKYRADEYIVIGRTSISIYPIGSECGEIETSEEWGFFDRKLQRLLYEFVLNQHSQVLLWEQINLPLENNIPLWETLLDLGEHIHIIDY